MDTVIAVYRRKNPKRKGIADVKIWCAEHGFHVPTEGFAHGQAFWAEVEGQTVRTEVRFSKTEDILLLLEDFAKSESRRHKERRSWAGIKRAVFEFFGGRKPEDVSWKKAKQMLQKAAREKDSDVEAPRLLSRGYRPPQSARTEAPRHRKDQTVMCLPPMPAPWPS
ncbi:MAG: hypothetical protein HZA81_00620 [Candidatus Taylorbacteria bacterium]|nr:hypothetical protein [Candidatus Taylorbacteria bacterium]